MDGLINSQFGTFDITVKRDITWLFHVYLKGEDVAKFETFGEVSAFIAGVEAMEKAISKCCVKNDSNV